MRAGSSQPPPFLGQKDPLSTHEYLYDFFSAEVQSCKKAAFDIGLSKRHNSHIVILFRSPMATARQT